MAIKKDKILLIGSGSWATALLKILTFNKEKVHWWVRKPEVIDFILAYHHNPKYLSSVEIDLKPNQVDHRLEKLIKGKDIVILATPSSFILDALNRLKPRDLQNKIIISAIKGMEPGTTQTVSEYIQEQFHVLPENCAAITGPCHAEEVANEKLSYLTFSSPSNSTAVHVSKLFGNRFIKTNQSADLKGTEYAAVLKNIYAVLAGICHGLGYGDNFQAVLVSNAMREMDKFLEVVHPIDRNLTETCYVGDLLVTAYSQFSRNRTFGNMIGKGYTIKSAQVEMNMVAEGYYAVQPIYELSKKLHLQTPLIDAVFHILYDNIAPSLEISLLASFLNQHNY